MSLTPLFADGFAQYTTAASVVGPVVNAWDTTMAPWTVGTNYGRFGGVGITVYSSGGSLIKTLPTATAVVGFAAAVSAANATAVLFYIYDAAGTIQGTIAHNADGSVSAYRGSSSALLGTSAPGVLPTGVLHHVEVQYKVDPTTGTVDVWVDGVSVLSLSAVNTRGSTVVGSNVARFALYSFTVTNPNGFCDVHAYDAAARTGATGGTFEKYGDKRIQTLFASGAGTGNVGAFTQVGGTGGSPYTAVNERPQNGDTSYVADSVAGDIISFALDDLAAGTTGITAIFPTYMAEKDDATARSIAAGVRTAGTNALGTTRTSPSSYAYLQDVLTTDGAGAALTVAGINASELLFKVVS